MRSVILERNKLVGRKVARWFAATGATAVPVDDPGQVAAALDETVADLLCADTFDGDLVAECIRARPGLRGLLWTAEPLRRSLRYVAESARIDNVLGRRDFESPPRAREVVMVARRIAGAAKRRPPHDDPGAGRSGDPSSGRSNDPTGAHAPGLAAYLDWGFTGFELDVRSSRERDDAVARIADGVHALAVPRRVGEMFGELAHELLMNAMYDAPVDAHGRPRFAGDRKADIVLDDGERATVRFGTDGSRLALQVRDPFGRLERHHVVDGLARGLAGGEMDRAHGGAGLGMMVCHNSSSAMFFDVVRGRHTEVTALFELDLNLREFRTQARSLHFWSR
ncbi:MAG: hypothetical protein KIT31_19140 [Deltaproteobacteria bacterium]|nr:hypothetical protein [Deltaproteobacteria bacterium]